MKKKNFTKEQIKAVKTKLNNMEVTNTEPKNKNK